MERTVNLERRIKRLAWGAEHSFFAVCPPGLEDLCADELVSLGVIPSKAELGGLHFKGRLELAYKLHLRARLISRLLLRLKDFRIRNLSDFKRKLAAIAWEVFLPENGAVQLHSDLGQSHLRHGPSLEEHLLEAIAERMRGWQPPRLAPEGGIRILLRTHEGRCSISLDLSGQHLHKRGYRLKTGSAPLRETLAAALLRFCNYDGSLPLLDPMCGSGTIPLEAAQIALNLPPGRQRQFNLNLLPCHRPAAWQHMLKQADMEARLSLSAPITAQDKASLKAAQENAARLGLAEVISWRQGDFWRLPALPAPGLLLVNPPYGVRLGSVRQGAQLSRQLGEHIKRHYQGWHLGILLYRPEWAGHFALARGKSLVFSHGGLRLTMLYGLVSPT